MSQKNVDLIHTMREAWNHTVLHAIYNCCKLNYKKSYCLYSLTHLNRSVNWPYKHKWCYKKRCALKASQHALNYVAVLKLLSHAARPLLMRKNLKSLDWVLLEADLRVAVGLSLQKNLSFMHLVNGLHYGFDFLWCEIFVCTAMCRSDQGLTHHGVWNCQFTSM